MLKITRGEYEPIPVKYSENLQNLVRMLLEVDPDKRPTVD
jgi:NIMA (never in mitosis gene a)-related kinase